MWNLRLTPFASENLTYTKLALLPPTDITSFFECHLVSLTAHLRWRAIKIAYNHLAAHNVNTYIDDISTSHDDFGYHLKVIYNILQATRKAGFKLTPKKHRKLPFLVEFFPRMVNALIQNAQQQLNDILLWKQFKKSAVSLVSPISLESTFEISLLLRGHSQIFSKDWKRRKEMRQLLLPMISTDHSKLWKPWSLPLLFLRTSNKDFQPL